MRLLAPKEVEAVQAVVRERLAALNREFAGGADDTASLLRRLAKDSREAQETSPRPRRRIVK